MARERRRGRRKVTDICKLCLVEANLCRSHIIPNFYYKHILSTDGRLYSVSSDVNKSARRFQSGIWENLLCQDCENKLSVYERHASDKLIHNPVTSPWEFGIELQVDYSLFKLHQLSLLWRMSVSKDPHFKEVSIGAHEEVIRRMLLNNDPGRFDFYPCLLIRDQEFSTLTDRIIMMPIKKVSERYVTIIALFGGVYWSFIIEDINQDDIIKNMYLSHSGKLFIRYDRGLVSRFTERVVVDFMPSMSRIPRQP